MSVSESFSDIQTADAETLECSYPDQNDELVAVFPLRYALSEYACEIAPASNSCDQRYHESMQNQLITEGYPKLEGAVQYCRKTLRTGWIYVRKSGGNSADPIWFEYEILHDGTFKQCFWKDNEIYTDHRPSNQTAVEFLLFEKGSVVELCYSPIQWTWAKFTEYDTTKDKPAKRMQFIDTSTLATTGIESDCISAEHLNLLVEDFSQQQNDRLAHKMRCKTKHIYGICLHDGINIITKISERYQLALDDLLNTVEENRHKQEVATLVNSITSSRPKLAKHIDSNRLALHSEVYGTELENKNRIILNHADNLKRWFEDKGPGSFYQAIDDFDLKVESQFVQAEAIIVAALDFTEHHFGGVSVLNGQFDKDDSVVQKVLFAPNTLKLATEPLNKILEKMVIINISPGRMQRLVDVLEVRFNIFISTVEVGAIAFFAGLPGSVEGNSVQLGLPITAKLTSVDVVMTYQIKQKVAYLDIPGRREIYVKTDESIDVTRIPGNVNGKWLAAIAPVTLFLNAYSLKTATAQFKLNSAEAANLLSNVIQTGMALGTIAKVGKNKLQVVEKVLDASKINKLSGAMAKKFAWISVKKLNVITTVLDAFYNVSKARSASSNHDTDAAWGYGIAVGGSLLTGVPAVAAVFVGVMSAPVALGIVILGTVIAIGGALYGSLTENTPMENWLNNCYFGAYAYKGTLKIYHFEVDTLLWRNNLQLEIESFYRALMPYGIEAKWKNLDNYTKEQSIEVTVEIPGFRVASAAFELYLTLQNDKDRVTLCSSNSQIISEWTFGHMACKQDDVHEKPIGVLKFHGNEDGPVTIHWQIEREHILTRYKDAFVIFRYLPNKFDALSVPNDTGDVIYLSLNDEGSVCKGFLPIIGKR